MNRRNSQDHLVYSLLIALGALAFVLSCRATDFVGDAYYFELAKSLLRRGGYEFDFRPQTMVPPGFPFLLALMMTVVGSSYAVLVRSMAVFGTLGLIATYEVLRFEESRWVAAAMCVLLGSSPEVFRFSTRLVFSDLPYLCTSMLLLWVILRMDSIKMRRRRLVPWWVLAASLVIVSVLMRSTGIALLSGILGWIGASFLQNKAVARRRLRILLPLVIVGLAVQSAWMHWAAGHQFTEWPVPGYQENYLAQLRLKSGNDPELGKATWQDVLLRPVHNADDRAAALMGLLTGKQGAPAWYSPWTLVPLGVGLMGLGYSFWSTGGGLLEWYFVSYEAMFLFWPWDFELRFVLPVVPLAWLYMWRGAALLWRLTRERPRAVGAAVFALSAAGCLSTFLWGWHVEHPSPRSCLAIWGLAAAASGVLSRSSRVDLRKLSLLLEKAMEIRGRRTTLKRILAAAVVSALVVLGVAKDLKTGWQNIHFDLKADASYPDIEAGEWIGGHSPATAVVMARKEDLVYHYGNRKVVWFPPSTNPKLLMDGIRRYHVQYVVVDGDDTYWRPPTQACFQALFHAYPGTFRLVHKGPRDTIFAVELWPQTMPRS